jgi:hypothetical protein
MNAFYEHHKDSIKFGYRCFDCILLNGLIQPFQQPERVIGFFNAYRDGQRVTPNCLRDIAEQFQNRVKNRCQKWGAPILEAPEGRRDNFVDPYFRHAKADEVVVILKAREPARIMIAIGKDDHWHLQLVQRWIIQYNFYINDRHWGRMFVRMCPYLPFSARVCLNQHHWLANRMRQQRDGKAFQMRHGLAHGGFDKPAIPLYLSQEHCPLYRRDTKVSHVLFADILGKSASGFLFDEECPQFVLDDLEDEAQILTN